MKLPPPFEFSICRDVSAGWRKWLRSFQNCIDASGITSARRKFALLMYIGGDELQDLFEILTPVASSQDGDDDYEVTVKAFTNHFNPSALAAVADNSNVPLVTSQLVDGNDDDDVEIHYVNYPEPVAVPADAGLKFLASSQDSVDDQDNFPLEEENESLPRGLNKDCQPDAAQEPDICHNGDERSQRNGENEGLPHVHGLIKDCQPDAAQESDICHDDDESSQHEENEGLPHSLIKDCQPYATEHDERLYHNLEDYCGQPEAAQNSNKEYLYRHDHSLDDECQLHVDAVQNPHTVNELDSEHPAMTTATENEDDPMSSRARKHDSIHEEDNRYLVPVRVYTTLDIVKFTKADLDPAKNTRVR